MSPADIIIRPADPPEAATVHALIQRTYRGQTATSSWSHEGESSAGERVSLGDLLRFMQNDQCRLSVALLAERVIGSYLVSTAAPGHCIIGPVSVDLEFQGKGIGKLLLADAEVRCMKSLGALRAEVEVLGHKRKLISYYKRRGYRETGEHRPYPHSGRPPWHFLILGKDLPQPGRL